MKHDLYLVEQNENYLILNRIFNGEIETIKIEK